MSSSRKIEANRENARRSSGPRTASGKRKVSQNARQHGLAVSIRQESLACSRIEELAQTLCPHAAGEQFEMVRLLAEAELDVLRVQDARMNVLRLHEVACFAEEPGGSEDQRDRSRGLEVNVADRIVKALREALPQLRLLHRYERRAIARRKRALLALLQSN